MILLNLLQILLNFKKYLMRKQNAESELEHKYERWEYLNNLAEEIENSKN